MQKRATLWHGHEGKHVLSATVRVFASVLRCESLGCFSPVPKPLAFTLPSRT